MKQKYFLLFVIGLFVLRMTYGLASDFWEEDNKQIYLIGLKSYTTATWPYYGPDIVYTKTQIPGALQGLLISLPLHLAAIPEAPFLFLGLLSFAILLFFANYLAHRFSDIPKWVVYTIVLTTSWVMHFSMSVVNPSYVILFSVPFFVCFIEIVDVYKSKRIPNETAFFVIGISTALVMQIHMSWILLLPFTALAFAYTLYNARKSFIKCSLLYILGASIGALTLLPTLFFPDASGTGDVANNIVFNWENFKNIGIVLTRFLIFAGYEVPYMLGTSAEARLAVVEHHLWMAPFTAYLYLFGFAQVALFIISFFQKNESGDWRKMKWITFGSYLLIFASFFFSIKGPAPHTFYIMLPIAMIYSFHCYRWIISKKKFFLKLLQIAAISGILFHIGLGIDKYENKSLYKNRALLQNAIDKKDYKILGTRRSDVLGHGY